MPRLNGFFGWLSRWANRHCWLASFNIITFRAITFIGLLTVYRKRYELT